MKSTLAPARTPAAVAPRGAASLRGPGRAIRRQIATVIGVCAFLWGCSSREVVAPNNTPDSKGTFLGTATVGVTLDQPVRFVVTDIDGNPQSNVAVHWTPSGDGRVSTEDALSDVNGVVETRWTLGTVSGQQTLHAKASDIASQIYTATATPDRAASIILSTLAAQLIILGDTMHVRGFSIDRFGNAVTSEPVYTIESGAEFITTVAPGAFLARARGTARIRMQVDTARATFTIAVTPNTPVIASVAPDTLMPGGTMEISGAYFALLSDFADLTVAGVHPVITSISDTHITAKLPAAASFPCLPTSTQAVRISIAGGTGEFAAPLRVANRITLATGESANVLDVQQVRCTELVEPASPQRAKYVVAVLNSSVTAGTYAGFELRASGGGPLSNVAATAQPRPATIAGGKLANADTVTSPASLAFSQLLAEEVGHADFLDRQRKTAQQYGSPAADWSRIRAARAGIAAVRAAPVVGDTLLMKAIYTSCSTGRDVRARVVYVGSKSLILEDVLSPRAGQIDAQYRSIGQEYDAVEYPLLRANIGDPLAMDQNLGGDGRVTMLFTRYVNDSLPGIQGYATACNFYPKATFAPSNEDEVFYARVPAANEDAEAWRRSMRSTVLHESKHLASFAERLARNLPFEESWLEESTARIAEELYSRTFAGGGSWKGNTGYNTTVRCEIYQCDDRPLMMWKHFSVLHQFFRGVDTLTPIGAAASGDFTFYASGWSLVRWAADQYAVNESDWLRELVRGSALVGLANLSARTGHPVDEMLANWSLANAVDDQVSFAAKRPALSFPSWNMPDMMSGLAAADPVRFGDVTPLRIRAFSFGSASLPVAKLRAFSSSYFSFEGMQSGSQVLEIRGENGGVLPASLRVAIVRVE